MEKRTHDEKNTTTQLFSCFWLYAFFAISHETPRRTLYPRNTANKVTGTSRVRSMLSGLYGSIVSFDMKPAFSINLNPSVRIRPLLENSFSPRYKPSIQTKAWDRLPTEHLYLIYNGTGKDNLLFLVKKLAVPAASKDSSCGILTVYFGRFQEYVYFTSLLRTGSIAWVAGTIVKLT